MIFLTRDRLHLHVARNGKGRRSGGGGGGGRGRLTWQVLHVLIVTFMGSRFEAKSLQPRASRPLGLGYGL